MGECAVTNNVAKCFCNSGYKADGLNCVDINECSENLDNYDENAIEVIWKTDNEGVSTSTQIKILSIDNWGLIVWQSINGVFFGCSNLILTATDSPNFTNCNPE